MVQTVCNGCLTSLRQRTDRMENVTPYRIRHLCNISAVGPAKVQGFGGLLRARKVSLDLPGKWVDAELWERSPALHAKQTHCLASQSGKRAVTGTFSGSDSCPSPAPQQSRECLSSSDSRTIMLTLQSPGAGEKLSSSLCFMDADPWEGLRETFPWVLAAVTYAAVRCTAGDQTAVFILGLRT